MSSRSLKTGCEVAYWQSAHFKSQLVKCGVARAQGGLLLPSADVEKKISDCAIDSFPSFISLVNQSTASISRTFSSFGQGDSDSSRSKVIVRTHTHTNTHSIDCSTCTSMCGRQLIGSICDVTLELDLSTTSHTAQGNHQCFIRNI